MRHSSDKEHLLRLTMAVYKVTAIFPVGEELRQNIRESADKILVNFLSDKTYENRSRMFDEILDLFVLAEEKSWVNPVNFAILRQEYEAVRPKKTIINAPILVNNSNGNRQEKIAEAINGGGVIKIGDILKMFPGVNRRTVLRDLDKLCETGVMVRNGNGRGVYYVKNGHNNATMSQ